MNGGIFTSEDCPICGQRMKDNGKDGVCCPKHSKTCRATTMFVKFPGVFKRFREYERAFQFLHGCRFKTGEGTFDERDYKRNNPLGFRNQADRYLEIKQATVKPGSFTHIKREMKKAAEWFGESNVKEIGYAQIEDYLLDQKGIAGKTRHNIKTILHSFFVWLVNRKEIRKDQMPDFPELPYELGWRKTIDQETQDAILAEMKRLTWGKNPRIYILAKWAATYINARPGELREILEQDIDRSEWVVYLKKHKTDRKTVKIKAFPLTPEDIELVKGLPAGFPLTPFFRRDTGGGGKHAGTPLGKHVVYDYWKKACTNLGIEGIDLYGGCRHSSARNLRRKGQTPEQIKGLTGHDTPQAFARYFEDDLDIMRSGYELTRQPAPTAPLLHLPKKS